MTNERDRSIAQLRTGVGAARELIAASDHARDQADLARAGLFAQVLSLIGPVLPGLSSTLSGGKHPQPRGVYLMGGEDRVTSLIVGENFEDDQPVLWNTGTRPTTATPVRCERYKTVADVLRDYDLDVIVSNLNDLLQRELRGKREKRTAKDLAMAAKINALAVLLER